MLKAKDEARRVFRQVGKELDQVRARLFNFKTAIAAAVGGYGLQRLTREVLQTADNFRRYQLQLEVLTGSHRKAVETWQQMLTFAEKTPFTIKEVMDTYTLLKAYGVEPTVEMMTHFGNVASVMGREVLPRLAYAIGQISAQGKVYAQDLRQLANAGINVNQILAQFGLTLHDVGESGLDAQTFLKALWAYLDRTYGGMMLEVMKTLTGQLDELKSKWEVFLDTVGKSGPYQAAVQALKTINREVDRLRREGKLDEWAKEIAEVFEASVHGMGRLLGFSAKVLDFIGQHPQMAEMGLVGTILFGRWGLAVGMAAGKVLEESGITSWEAFKRKVEELFTFTVERQNFEEFREGIKRGLRDLSSGGAFKIDIMRMEDVRETESAFSGLAKVLEGLAKELKNFKIDAAGAADANKRLEESHRRAGDAAGDQGEQLKKLITGVDAYSKRALDAYDQLRKYQKSEHDRYVEMMREVQQYLRKEELGEYGYRLEKLREWYAEALRLADKFGGDQAAITEYYLRKCREIYDQWGEHLWNEYDMLQQKHMETMGLLKQAVTDVAHEMRYALSDFFFKAAKGEFDDFADVWNSFCDSLLRIWSDYMAQMAMNFLFGPQFMGGGGMGGLFGGLLGGLFGGGGGYYEYQVGYFAKGGILPGGFKPLQHGGIITKPTLGLIGEGPYPEAVVPLPGDRKIPVRFEGGRPGQTVIININAVDARSFEELCRRNPGAIVQPVLENINRAGILRAAIRETT
ncbi:MAG: hypothetical protein DRG40_00690 [Deltaproteobacteria bacterium]|nr:MAG: hypothetical protein DRG40_00690 [Deltaproteobacteria bacterium]